MSKSNYLNLKSVFKRNERVGVILITIVFFLVASYVAFNHHPYFAEDD